MSKPLVSVIIPIYNTEAYLPKCLDSVCDQSLRNIEIICVNDGSTDACEEIIKGYCKKDPRVQLVNKPNGGLSSARNAGLKVAQGKYCYFMDSDDYIEQIALELLAKESEENQLDIVYFGGKPFGETEEILASEVFSREKEIWVRPIVTDVLSGEELFVILQNNKIFRSSVCIQFYKTDFLKKNEFLFAEGFVHEDFIYTYQTALAAERVKCIDNLLFCRRLRPESIVTSKVSHKNFEGRFFTYIQSIFISQNHNTEKTEVFDAMKDYIKVSYNNSVAIYKRLSEDERKKIFVRSDSMYDAIFAHMGYHLK